MFSAEQLDKLVAETLPADAKPGTKVVVGTVDQHGAQVVASLKLTDHWEVQAVAHHEWDNSDNVAAAKVLLRW